MGAFFSNVQVRVGGARDEAVGRIRACLEQIADGEGLRLARPGERADRTIVLWPSDTWIAVYDEATETQATETLDELARKLSKAVGGYALASLVHDSSVLALSLFRNGRAWDRFNSDPDYFARLRANERAKLTGIAKRWRDLCDEKALAEAFAARDSFVETTLERVSVALGLNPERTATGYNYLTEGKALADEAIAVRFVDPVALISANEPTEIAFDGATSGGKSFEGMTQHFSLRARSLGAPSMGLTLLLWGDAIEQTLWSPLEAALTLNPKRERSRGLPRSSVSFSRVGMAGGAVGYLVQFPDAALTTPGRAAAQNASLFAPSPIEVWFSGSALRAGNAKFNAGLRGIEAPTAGFYHQFSIEIGHAGRRPLKASDACTPPTLELIEDDRRLFALLAFAPTVADPGLLAFRLLQRWSSLWPADGSCRCALFPKERSARLAEFETTTAELTHDPKFRLRNALASAARVDVKQQDAETMAGIFESHGFSFGGALLSPAADELRSLLLWVGVPRLSPERLHEAELLAQALCDEVMRDHAGVQALVGRWGSRGLTLDSNGYESACGIQQQVTLRAAWQERFLRGVTRGPIWLGPALLHALGELGPLRELAELLPVGAALKVIPNRDVSLEQLERALAPILPSKADYDSFPSA